MALKATIFKATLSIADMDRHYYADHHLTIAQHPSETDERMMIRLLAFALNADEHLEFTKGLSTDDEPELWRKSLSDEIELWIELGLPEEGRLRKACNRARQVILYTYGGRAVPLWWEKHHHKLERFGNLTVIDLPQEATAALASLAQRGMSLQITVQDGVVGVADDTRHVQIEPAPLS
ncbi:YaeQ family protein [Marinobacter arenosus]|uniref:YaeQ family protein n=1 Tax=Marinobacter arenosus TaxID=2856822 RepID=UPI001C4D78EC|nr:YaeQ family protein [Marinobacter arenosus]MBW0148543.1 YaeQ family protein [Marinobacter arenosus]